MTSYPRRFSLFAKLSPAFFACAWLLVSISTRAQTNTLPPHPRLLLDANGIAALEKRIATVPWAKTSWKELRARVDKQLAQPVVLPPRGGNWSHNYVCPEHGARLKQGKQIGPWQWEHICPIGDHVLRGDPAQATLDFDGNAIANIHANYAREIIDDGLVYQVTGDARYAARAREILLAYADRYLTYPVHDNQGRPSGRGGHVASQSLTEATWLIDIAQGADLVWNTLSESDRAAITDKMLRPALNEIIIPQKYGIHNIQCRENSAIGLIGFLLNDPSLISLAIDDPQYGFRAQMQHGVLPGGFWLEGSTGYHFFAMDGMWPLMEAARNCGTDVYGPEFKSLFDGPLSLAMPNLSLPNFNDSGISPLESHADIYELAVARYHDPAYNALLSTNRSNRMALLFGSMDTDQQAQFLSHAGTTSSIGREQTQFPSSSGTTFPSPIGWERAGVRAGDLQMAMASHNLTGPGYAILERGTDTNATWLAMKYGPHGGGHGHPDKNSFILYARGEIVAPDVGTHAYGSPLHMGWDKTTLAHNTLVVDEKSQEPAQGKCLAFGSEHNVDYSVTDAGPIYPGVRFIRTAAMLTPDLIVFIDQIEADAPHTFDLAYHQVGTWEKPQGNLPAGEPWSSTAGAGYKYFTDAISMRDDHPDSSTSSFKTKVRDGWDVAVAVARTIPSEIIIGYGIWKTTEDKVPMLVQRRHAQRTAFIWAASLDGTPVALRVMDVTDASGKRLEESQAVAVQATGAGRNWLLLANPGRQPVNLTLADASHWQTAAPFAVH